MVSRCCCFAPLTFLWPKLFVGTNLGGVGSWEVAVFLNASKLQLLLDVRIFEWFTWNRILNIM